MGLKHLKKIEKILRSGKDYTKTDIRDKINTDYKIVLDVFSYLLSKNLIQVLPGKIKRYKWIQKKKGK